MNPADFISTTTVELSFTTSDSVSVDIPDDVEAGDLLLIFESFHTNSTIPGFTHIANIVTHGDEEVAYFYRVADGTETSVSVALTTSGDDAASFLAVCVKADPVLSALSGYASTTPQTTATATAADLTASRRANLLLTVVAFSDSTGYTSSSNPNDVFIDIAPGDPQCDAMALIARDASRFGAAGATHTTTGAEYGTISLLVSVAAAGPEVWVIED